ncbi:polysaccharide deacetylase family protein [Streptomyces apocyni]|uniref:polysaccharide deacetylase family protein n=1 Tax=Streptomyces apocyni TaxID=2654677 RepID=UPI0012E9E1D7|nr:polysaccharide deacetylase family protein [Streptomyces apocyni]
MKNDEPLPGVAGLPGLPGRRTLLRGAALFGLLAAAGCSSADRPGTPTKTPTPAASPAPGPPASRPQNASAYRLRPMTGMGPPRELPVRPAVRAAPILRMTGADRRMVLTFDDGPDPRYTSRILKTLRQYDVRAMFFVCGEMAEAHPDLLRQMADDGHAVENHTWSHPELTRLTRSAIRRQIERTSDLVDALVGEPPRWFRAPYGAWNRDTFELGSALGMEPLAWTVDTLDWREPGSGTIVRRVLDGAGPGVVVLSHDAGGDRSQSVQALRVYLPRLLDAGYEFSAPRSMRI